MGAGPPLGGLLNEVALLLFLLVTVAAARRTRDPGWKG